MRENTINNKDQDYIGYFKYEGKLVEDGYMDARQSAEALIGIDNVFRYFILQVDPKLQEIDFQIPVKIRKGSWEALIPQDLQQWLITAVGLAVSTYGTTAAKKMAENDFGEVGFKDVLKKVFQSINWVIRIAVHVGSLARKQFIEAEFKEDNKGEMLVGIPNEKNEMLYVPKGFLDMYINCPEKLFSLLTKSLDPEKSLQIGINDKEEPIANRTVNINFRDKFIFTKEEETNETLFPELKHNQYVELEGHVTRGNENANTIGFEYLKHILTCSPIQGNIKDYKEILFTNCILKGYVDRMDKDGNNIESRPRIKYIELKEIKSNNSQATLF